MAERRVVVKFAAEIAGFRKAMEEAAAATQKVKKVSEEASATADTHLGRLVQSAHKNREAWETAGAGLAGFGTAAVAGLGLAGKAAMDWESAWAGVTKTVDGTPAQMDELEASLRGLAKTLPATHEEIAGVAEAAGQLGVKRADVVGFTETMIALGETTNLSADEASTAIAQISNVMGTMEREGSEGVERFSATLVALGNAGASTEADIVSMAKRIAGAGKLVGASESDVLALANAMASVGIEAELGGGVISRVMQRMYGDVQTGGEGLDNLAKVAGVSSKDFATAFETDPVRAVDAVVQGLSRVKAEGGNVIDTMADLGIKGTEETSVILRLAGAGDLLADSLKLGDEAWKSNSALAEEAAKRYETTEAKVQIAWNNIKDAAIDAGAVLLPLVAGVAESVAGVAQVFASLPEPVKGALTVLGGVAGAAALGAGAFLTLTPRILDSVQAFQSLNTRADGTSRGMGKVAKNAGIATAGLLALNAAGAIGKEVFGKAEVSTAQFAQGLLSVADGGNKLDALFKDGGIGTSIDGVGDAIKRMSEKTMFDEFSIWLGDVSSSGSKLNTLRDNLSGVDGALSGLVAEGKSDEAAKGFQAIAKAAEEQGVPVEKLVDMFPQYRDKLLEAKNAAGETGVTQDDLSKSMIEGGKATEESAAAMEAAAAQSEEIAEALEEIGVAADGTVTDLVKFTEVLINAGLLQLSARDAARGFEEAIDAMSESLAKNGRTLDTTTAAGRANEAALDAIAGAGFRSAGAMAANGASQEALQGNLKTTYDRLVESARAFTATDDEAIALARDIMKVPPNVSIDSWMDDEAKRMAQATTGELDKVDGRVVTVMTRNITQYEEIFGDTGKSAGLFEAQNGGATGGRVSDIMGLATGGIVPGNPPSNPMVDNILATVNGKPLAVRSGEWIINEGSSRAYDRELAAINAGTFPKIPGYANGGRAREYSASEFARPANAAGTAGPVAMTGTLTMDSGEVLGVFRGVATQVARGEIANADSQSQRMRRGR